MFADLFADEAFWVAVWGAGALTVQICLGLAVVLRVIMTRHPPGSSFAWIMLTLALPFVGFLLYILFGERPIGRWRAYKLKHILNQWEKMHADDPQAGKLPSSMRHKGLVELAQKLGDLPQARVFMYSKLLGTHIQHNGCNQCNTSKNNYCNQNKVHKFCICFSC